MSSWLHINYKNKKIIRSEIKDWEEGDVCFFPYLMVGLYGACFVLRAELKSMFAKNGWHLMSSEPFFPILRSSLKIKSKWEKRNKEDKDSFERYGGSFWKGHWPYMENLWIVNIDVDTKFIIIKSIKSLCWPRWLDIKETLSKGRIWGISPPGKVPTREELT